MPTPVDSEAAPAVPLVVEGPESREPEGAHRTGSRLVPWLTLALLFLVAGAVHFALSVHMRTPIVQADEFGYLQDGRYLARGGPPPGMPYAPGYSLLLVPLWWLTNDPATVYRGALCLNAALAGLTAVLLYLLARRLVPRVAPSAWVMGAVAVSAYPAYLLFSDIAESENLLLPGFLAVCLLAVAGFRSPTAGRWAALGAATGLLYLVHGRAIAVAAALVLTAVWTLRPWRRFAPALAAGAGALAATIVASQVLTTWVTRPISGQQLPSHTASPEGLLVHGASTAGFARVGALIAGQGLYLLTGTAGLLVLGVAALWRSARVRPNHREDTVGPSMARFFALCVGATAVLAAVALGNGDRVDIIVYGRYVEVFAAPVLLLGGLAAADRLRRIRLVRFIGGGTVAVAVTAACVIGYWGVRVAGAPQRTNTFAVDHVFRLTGGEFQAGIFAAIALGALVVVVGAYRLGAAIGMVVVIATFVPATAYGYSEVVDQSTGALLNRTLPDALLATQERFHGPGCVGWDRSMDSAAVSWLFFNTRLFDPGRTFGVFDSAAGGVPCSPLVVASSRFSSLEAYRGARMVVPTAGPAVWVLPGALQARLDRAGWLLPAGWPAALPDAARHGSLRLLDAAGRAVPTVDLLTGTGHSVSVRIQVNHADQGPAWPAAAAIGTVPRYAVRLGISWYPAGHDGQPAVATARADLPVSLLPGRSATLTAPLGSVDLHGAPIPTGRYDVEISVIQEGVADFAATIPPVWVHVRVLSR